MFTRSQSRAITNPSDSGSSSQPSKIEKKKPAEKFMGIRLRGKANQKKYRKFGQRDIRTKTAMILCCYTIYIKLSAEGSVSHKTTNCK